MIRYAFYISGRSSRLRKFLDQANTSIVQQVKVVISDLLVDEDLRKKLKTYRIKLCEHDYDSLGRTNQEKNRIFSDNMLTILKEHQIDYCFSFGSHLLSGELLSEYSFRIINFHPAILPMFPGRKSIDQAVQHGNVLLVGNTAHFIDSGMDTGMIIMQSVAMMKHFIDSNFDYDFVLDLQIPMLNSIINAINNCDLCVENGKVCIKNADYSLTDIYPKYSKIPPPPRVSENIPYSL